MNLRLALAAAFLAAAIPAASGAPSGRAAACLEAAPLQPGTVFDVVVATYPTVVERRLNIKEINGIRPIQLPPKAVAHGLSVADFRLRYTTKSEGEGLEPGGHTCAWVGGVAVDLTPEVIRIYIPSEYAPNSCESKQLLLHEMEHERLSRRELLNTAGMMRFALAHTKNLPGPGTPISAATPEEAYARLKRMVDQVVRPIYEDFLKNIRSQQERLDDPETYRRLGESCSGWRRT